MGKCLPNTTVVLDETPLQCDEFINSDCVLYMNAISYLNLPPQSTVTEIVVALLTSLIDTRARLENVENNALVDLQDLQSVMNQGATYFGANGEVFGFGIVPNNGFVIDSPNGGITAGLNQTLVSSVKSYATGEKTVLSIEAQDDKDLLFKFHTDLPEKVGGYILATLDDIVDTRPYKVYTALLTQSGTDAPIATVMENTLGDNLIFTYLNNGYYGVTSNSPVFEGNFICEQHRGIFTNEQGESSQLYSITIENITNTGFTISTRPHQNPESNDMLYQRYFEIKIYKTV